ncbi:Propeptide, PepSY amd peptidase M4 [Nitrosococcus oceani ATCC 19707]|uniref:Propeptide, PepSY amd peptidase M4 n=2 Tax=Nitrosococcus oceani TaxID=1229 RepID=Q3JBE9_NITOC|nr:PepSY domain-containing protein [Nitrosococcus oceani]ABA57847.1 Propeptide, PepSY amd peptidase M4 [Nitrosococcus oceani ATCC 19707]KFI19727.1 peptidase [Nitrosococcus oceani C-27]
MVRLSVISKTTKRPWTVLLVILTLALGMSGTLKARDLGHEEALRLRQTGTILPFEQILARALKAYPGAQLLESELEREDGLYVYELEILTPAGVVHEIEINANNGQFIEDEIED